MTYSNYHTHTTYCDGADSPEELVLEAIRLGCPEIGFSGHSYLEEDTGSMSPEGTVDYCRESDLVLSRIFSLSLTEVCTTM